MALTKVKNSVTSFTQDGTGAVERGMEDKLREFVSVSDFAGTDTEALQAAFNHAKATGKAVYAPGSYTITETLEYDTTGMGFVQGLQLYGDGGETTEIINAIAAGGPTIQLTSGASVADFQYGGEISGIKFSESGSGANSHAIEYRGTWRQKFNNLHFDTLNGSGIKCVNSAADADSSAHVLIEHCYGINCSGPGYDSNGNTGGTSVHEVRYCQFNNCGGTDGNVVLDGTIHFKCLSNTITSNSGGAGTNIGYHIKGTTVTPQAVVIENGEIGNYLQKAVYIDKGIGITLGGFRIVKRTGENTLTKGIEVSDGNTVQNLTINPIVVSFDDATPAATLFDIGTSIGGNFVICAPRQNTFAGGNTYLSYAPTNTVNAYIEDQVGEVVRRKPLTRLRTTVASPGNLDSSFLTSEYHQFLITGAGSYTLTAPTVGVVDGQRWKVAIYNASGGAITVSFAASINVGAYTDPANLQIVSASYIYDSLSAKWRLDGDWSAPHTG